jgi:uncharacterized protein YbjQ (UPF0145 family)
VIITTTGAIEGQQIDGYLGVVTGRAVARVNVVRAVVSEMRDRVGARIVAGSYVPDRPEPYQLEYSEARQRAMDDLQRVAAARGADAVIGVTVDYRTVVGGTMVVVTASGTAVRIREAA